MKEEYIVMRGSWPDIFKPLEPKWGLRETENSLTLTAALNVMDGISRERKAPVVERILKSGNRTIVFWKDGTKTIVKRAEDEADNDYAAFTAALGIKLYGSNSALKRVVRKVQVQKPKRGAE